jgi:hypothetical protein
MIKISGNKMIDILCERLTFLGKFHTDHNIRKLLSTLDNYELNQLISLGNVIAWHNELINKNNEMS